MPRIRLDHFRRAATDIGSHGDNDTLPFDVDNRFMKQNAEALANIAYAYCEELAQGGAESARKAINSLNIFSERLLAPTGPAGFRITTKIHPFWNMYFNGLGISIAEALEPTRSDRAHSYRFAAQGDGLFVREASWRAFREATVVDCLRRPDGAFVVQTDISSFACAPSWVCTSNLPGMFSSLNCMAIDLSSVSPSNRFPTVEKLCPRTSN